MKLFKCFRAETGAAAGAGHLLSKHIGQDIRAFFPEILFHGLRKGLEVEDLEQVLPVHISLPAEVHRLHLVWSSGAFQKRTRKNGPLEGSPVFVWIEWIWGDLARIPLKVLPNKPIKAHRHDPAFRTIILESIGNPLFAKLPEE